MPTLIEQLQAAIANQTPISDELRAQAIADIKTATDNGSVNFPRIVRGLLNEIDKVESNIKIVITEPIAAVSDEQPVDKIAQAESEAPNVGVREILQMRPRIHGR